MSAQATSADLSAGIAEARREVEYRSSFKNWHRRASVRVASRRVFDELPSAQLYFRPELTPSLEHPLVAGRGPAVAERLLIHRLYEYMHFTAELEAAVVVPLTLNLARNRTDLALPDLMRADAYKIVTDEAWHAQFSFDLLTQVESQTGVICRTPGRAQFDERLSRIRDRLHTDVRGLTDLMSGVVSETLISSILAKIPTDRRISPAVREVVRDHAEDEGRHHAYFHHLLRLAWPTLDRRQRDIVGPALPDLIFAFLEPDYRATALALVNVGFKEAEVEQILVESYPRPAVESSVRAGAQATLGYLSAEGVLDSYKTYEAFARAGLVDE